MERNKKINKMYMRVDVRHILDINRHDLIEKEKRYDMLLLPTLDTRLENRLIELYKEHKERAANIDWSYHEFVPWEQGSCFKKNPWSIDQRKQFLACGDVP